jgi:CDP-glycerol glycerophosphotransferase
MPEPTPLLARVVPTAKKVVRRVAGKQIVERRRRVLTPELTVVMPVYNVAEYLPEALDSVLSQDVSLELIAVDDSSTDDCLAILRSYERRDPRVKVLTQPNSGQGVARNLAVGYARGELLTFVDSDDTIPPGSFAHMIARLRESGSDFCVGNVRRFKHQHYTRTVWARTVHSRDRLGTTLEEFPNAMQDIIACNRMFRTAFWRSDVGDFRGHIAYEDHVPMLTAYVRAKRFDILARVTYNWRIRENRTSTGQQKADLENLLDRITVKEEAHDLLTAEASDFVYDTWVGRTLEVDFPPFVRHAVTGPDSYRNILAATYRTYLDRATPRALDLVTVRQKVRGHLAAQERWDDVTRADTWFEDVGLTPPAHAEDGPDGRQVVADEQPDAFLQGLPDAVRRLSPLECHFHGVLSRVAWGPSYAAPATVQLTGWAVRRGLGVRGPATLRAWLVDSTSGETVKVPVESVNLPEANIWGQQRFAPYDGGGFEVSVDCSTLPARVSSWHLRVETTYDGVTSVGPIVERMPRSSAHRPSGTVVELEGRVASVRTRWDAGHGFTLDVDPDPVTAESLSVDGGVATGVLVVPGGREVRGVELRNPHRPAAPATTTRRTAGSGRMPFEVPVPVVSGAPQQERSWDLVVLGAGRPAAPVWAGDDAAGPETGRGTGPHAWVPSLALGPVLTVASPTFEVTGVELGEDTLTFTVTGRGVTEEQLSSVRLGNPRVTLDRLPDARPEELTFSLLHETVTGARRAVPSARYELTLPPTDGALTNDALTATVSGDLSGELPRFDHGTLVDLEVGQTPDGRLTLAIEPPLPPEARGISGRRRLRDEFRALEATPSDAVAFACYRGEFATDSQLALDRGFARLHPATTRYWGVLDASTEVPDGAVPLLLDSREWYAALASARSVSNNIDFGLWFHARPYQRYLQTFHGYPFKSMGVGHWRSKGLNEEAIAQELVKVNREWDTILVPSEECSSFYREQYAWGGEILVAGYPRCDALVAGSPWAEDASVVRARVLGRLGVLLEKTVVLYAPTYRDSLTTRTFAARRFDELDLAALVRSLGEEHVVLLRGHNNNQRELDRVHGVNRVVDVTDWPDVNELTLAADVAVLDYSSLRFDWALTGKPMVFFVPDLEEYFAERAPLFPYAGTAPGPWVSTTDEVAAALADLPGLRASYAAEIATFNARFNALHDGRATDRVLEWFLS